MEATQPIMDHELEMLRLLTSALGQSARNVDQRLKEALSAMAAKEAASKALTEAIKEYNDARDELLWQRWQESGNAYCTVCKRILPKEGFQLFSVSKKRLVGKGGSKWVPMLESDSYQHGCPECYACLLEKSEPVDPEGVRITISHIPEDKIRREDGKLFISLGGIRMWSEIQMFPIPFPAELERELGIPPTLRFCERDRGLSLAIGSETFDLSWK